MWATSILALHMPVAKFLIFASNNASSGICSLSTVLQASVTVIASWSCCAWILFYASSSYEFSMNIFSFFTLYSLMRLSACFSRALNSAIHPTCSMCRYSFWSVARLMPMFFKELTMALSSAASVLKDPSHSATAQRSNDRTISVA